MQTALSYRTNRDLFSNHYLDEHLPETAEWNEVNDEELKEAYDDIMDLWEREKSTAPKRNESQLEEKFIRPMFRKLGIPFEVEESTSRTQRRPDYGFFDSEDAARDAFERREEGGDFYENAVAVADAKRWGRPLDTRGSGEHERDFENPSYQIHVYLQETPARWAVLTDGKKWRLYYGPTSHRLDSYYEVDLATILESGDLEDFKYFYLFFRHDSFLEDASGDCFLDDVYDESNVFAQELGEDLQDNIYEAIKILSEGFLQYPENDLKEDDLELIHDSSLIYLYRLIFVLYAEAEGRDLLDTDNEIYEQSYSLNSLKQEIAAELDSGNPTYRDWQDDLWDRLDELFKLVDQGSKSRGIPEEDLYIPAYNGGLFRTDPDVDDSPEAKFLADNRAGDAHLAKVIDLLTRSQNGNGGGKIFVDYSSLDVRHLGSIYEGLLEYRLNVADEPLALEEGEYAIPDEGDAVVVEEGEVYLTTDSGERKATGSYYTPEYVVEYIVENTLGPLVEDIRMDLAGQSAFDEGGFAAEFAERIFELKILDPAMGSGHFLTSAVDYLAREIIDAQEKQAAQQGLETVDEGHDINWARRKVAQRCIYGVDLNPLAVELAKVSLWLRTLAAEQPLAFLDHHLKTGNSLVGSDIEDVLANGDGDAAAESGQLTLQQSFDRTRQQAIEHVMDRFQNLLSIDNETLADAKEMEDVYDEVRDDSLYRHLLAMANVYTAKQFGLDVPSDAFERMARALKSDSWASIEDQDWFKDAQAMADEEQFFHWELEFPVSFYNIEGDRKSDAGFDAVIGNPPYVSSRNEGFYEVMGEYVDSNYDLAVYQVDLYLLFTELAVQKTKFDGNWSYIKPDVWMGSVKGKEVRKWFVNQGTIEKIALPKDRVFQADVDCLILLGSGGNRGTNVIQVVEMDPDGESGSREAQLPEGGSVFPVSENAVLLDKIEENTVEIDDISKTGRGIGPYHHSQHSEETIENREFHSDCEEDETYRPELAGKDIKRHTVDWNGDRWISYGDWLAEPRSPELFEGERLLCRKILSDRLCCVFVDSDWLVDQQVYVASQFKQGYSAQYATALLASSLMGFYARTKYHEDTELFPHLRVAQFRELPIHEISFTLSDDELEVQTARTLERLTKFVESGKILEAREVVTETLENKHPEVIHETLSELVETMSDRKERRHSLNLDLLDYLGNYDDGPKLPDVGLFQPTSTGVLDATAEEYENLRIGDVRTERDGATVTVSATARYKPEDEDIHETDQWGYTETGFKEAFSLTDLSEAEAALVEAFIPVAASEAGGFAGFRENATKTNSLIDRLKTITLPNPDDVADDLERYVETKERAEELDEEVKKTDQVIDEIVYDLYDLTDEEIEIVEEAVGQ